MPKLISPREGWLRLLWGRDDLPSELRHAVDAAGEIPGCWLGPQALDIPRSAVMLPEVTKIFELLGAVAENATAAMRYHGNTGHNSFEPLRPLYEHQRRADAFLYVGGGGLLADEMGLGKTASAIVAAERERRDQSQRAHRNRPGVIVGPLFARAVWRRELLALGAITDNPDDFCSIESRDLNDPCFHRNAKWYFVHYDVAIYWWSRIHQLKPAACIVDEIHWAKNGRAKRSVAAGQISLPVPFRIGLTGTPIESTPQDLWWPLTLVSGPRTWGGPLDFRKRYCGAVPSGYGGHEDTGPTHVEELKLRLNYHLLRREEKDVGLDMPPLTRTFLPVPCAVENRHYAMRDIVAAIIAGNVADVLPLYSQLRNETSNLKLKATVEQVENALAQGTSIVVFSWLRKTTTQLADMIDKKWRRFRVTGEDEQSTRDHDVEQFQTSTEPAALFATFGALREGVTLHRARVVIMHDLDLSIGTMLQAEKRIHRIGQRNACQSIWMLAEDSIDTLIAPLLVKKAELIGNFFESGKLDLERLATVQGGPGVDEQIDTAMNAWLRGVT